MSRETNLFLKGFCILSKPTSLASFDIHVQKVLSWCTKINSLIYIYICDFNAFLQLNSNAVLQLNS